MKFGLSLLVAALVLVTGNNSFGREKINMDLSNVASKEGVFSMWATWIKDKGKKYDINFHIRNDSEKFIIVMLNDMQCMRGSVVGQMKYTFFNTGERTIDMGPGQEKGANMVCLFSGPVTGEIKVTVKHVFDNPTQDRKTPGKIIAKDIVWAQNGGSTKQPADAPKKKAAAVPATAAPTAPAPAPATPSKPAAEDPND